MFFEYIQNNSGGHFDYNKKRGITHFVVIEAANADLANKRAEDIGMYWDGCETRRDCPCCGDRWCPQYDNSDGTEAPEVYGQPVTQATTGFAWMKSGREIAVHYADGRIEWHGVMERDRYSEQS